MSLHSNDPCHCGSGKKYRQCCMNKDYTPASPVPEIQAIVLVLDWLIRNHKKAYESAILKMLKQMLSDEEMHILDTEYDQHTQASFQFKIYEWLLAEGEIFAKGEMHRLNAYLLGNQGPVLTPKQRDWLVELGNMPLRLYFVTDVVQSRQITLCDALNPEALPVVVQEKLGTNQLFPGTLVATRILRVGDHLEASVIYLFGDLKSYSVAEKLRAVLQDIANPQDAAREMGLCLMREWMRDYVRDPEYLGMVDVTSGESIQFVTDHYSVNDWPALERLLAACPDVESDGKNGWFRLPKDDIDLSRPLVHVGQGEKKNTLELFSTSLTCANQARLWLEVLAPERVYFVSREEVNPRGKNIEKIVHPSHPRGRLLYAKAADMPVLMEKAIHRLYADWPDTIVPIFGNKTPRQAMQTPGGLERVKGLIRGFEAKEKRTAEMQKREPVSFAFLWQSLGLTD